VNAVIDAMDTLNVVVIEVMGKTMSTDYAELIDDYAVAFYQFRDRFYALMKVPAEKRA